MNMSLDEALEKIIWYDCLYDWLEELADEIEKTSSHYKCPFESSEWGDEEHFVYMLLVGMFGDWGTSIRSGWIENKKECVEYIRAICKKMRDAERNIEE